MKLPRITFTVIELPFSLELPQEGSSISFKLRPSLRFRRFLTRPLLPTTRRRIFATPTLLRHCAYRRRQVPKQPPSQLSNRNKPCSPLAKTTISSLKEMSSSTLRSELSVTLPSRSTTQTGSSARSMMSSTTGTLIPKTRSRHVKKQKIALML